MEKGNAGNVRRSPRLMLARSVLRLEIGRPAAGALSRQHPARIFGRKRAHLVELRHIVFIELKLDGGKVLVELVDTLGAMMTVVTKGLARI